MSDDTRVSHPQVSHPDTDPVPGPKRMPSQPHTPQQAPSRAGEPKSGGRSSRHMKMPPPKVLAAVVLAAAAVELLIWQLGGLWWGIGIHAGLLLAASAATSTLARLRRRKAGTPAGHRVGGLPGVRGRGAFGSGTAGKAGFGRLFGRTGKGTPGTGGRRGLGRLFGAAGKGTPNTAGKAGFGRLFGRTGRSTPGTGGRRGLGRLFGGAGRSTPGGSGKTGTGRLFGGAGKGTPGAGGRRGLGRLFGKADKNSGKPGTGSKTGFGRLFGGASKGAPASANRLRSVLGKLIGHNKSKPGNNPGNEEHSKPDQEPDDAQPTKHSEPPANKAKPATVLNPVLNPGPETADPHPATITTATPAPHSTGGTTMGHVNKINEAAEQLADALTQFDPEDMHELVRAMPMLSEAWARVADGTKRLATRAETEWPVGNPVVDLLHSMAADTRAISETAGEVRSSLRRENETDIERGEAPRKGLRNEARWNVTGNN